MNLAKLGQSMLDKIAHASVDKMGDVLILTSIAGWIASSSAQILGIAFNKSYTKEQKRFMVRQEAADALINILSFFIVTKSLKALTSKLVSTGKLAPKKVVEFLKDKNLLDRRGKFDFHIPKVEGFKEIRQTYNGFKNFADSSAAVVGGVLSSNIITPILRNEYASRKQNEDIARMTKPYEYKPTINTKPHSFDDFRRTSLRI